MSKAEAEADDDGCYHEQNSHDNQADVRLPDLESATAKELENDD